MGRSQFSARAPTASSGALRRRTVSSPRQYLTKRFRRSMPVGTPVDVRSSRNILDTFKQTGWRCSPRQFCYCVAQRIRCWPQAFRQFVYDQRTPVVPLTRSGRQPVTRRRSRAFVTAVVQGSRDTREQTGAAPIWAGVAESRWLAQRPHPLCECPIPRAGYCLFAADIPL
jgi:hypothetical protein